MPTDRAPARLRALVTKHPSASRVALFALAAALYQLAVWRETLAVAGGPALALDDAFIHIQYARSLAEGHPFRYGGPTDPPSSGATSVLYVLALAPFYLFGARGLSMAYPALAFGAAGAALTAEGLYRLASRLFDRTAGALASAVPFVCAPYLFALGSGMETTLAAALVAHAFAAMAALDETRDDRDARLLAALGAAAPFVRTELACVSLLAAAVLAWRARGRAKLLALAPLAAVASLLALWRLLTGTVRTTGASAKWLFLQPNLAPEARREALARAALGLLSVLRGAGPVRQFLPAATAPLVALGYLAALARALRARRFATALVVLASVPLFFVPATVVLWDVHRGRYFVPTLLVPLACACVSFAALGRLVFVAALRVARGAPSRAGDRLASFVAGGLGAAWLGLVFRYGAGAKHDVADCARQISDQILHLAGDVAQLPPAARVLVNDAGALRYLGGHETVDLMGLTTQSFAGAHAAGAGSVFEALDRLPPARRPTHAAVYEAVLENSDILGDTLTVRVSNNVTILGGNPAVLRIVDGSMFGSGAAPLDPVPPGLSVVDEVDVADLESERAHEYVMPPAARATNHVRWDSVNGRRVMEGGRLLTSRESFTVRARPGLDATLLLRTNTYVPVDVTVLAGGSVAAVRHLPRVRRLVDERFAIPGRLVSARTRVEVRIEAGHDVGTFHYFVLQ